VTSVLQTRQRVPLLVAVNVTVTGREILATSIEVPVIATVMKSRDVTDRLAQTASSVTTMHTG